MRKILHFRLLFVQRWRSIFLHSTSRLNDENSLLSVSTRRERNAFSFSGFCGNTVAFCGSDVIKKWKKDWWMSVFIKLNDFQVFHVAKFLVERFESFPAFCRYWEIRLRAAEPTRKNLLRLFFVEQREQEISTELIAWELNLIPNSLFCVCKGARWGRGGRKRSDLFSILWSSSLQWWSERRVCRFFMELISRQLFRALKSLFSCLTKNT